MKYRVFFNEKYATIEYKPDTIILYAQIKFHNPLFTSPFGGLGVIIE